MKKRLIPLLVSIAVSPAFAQQPAGTVKQGTTETVGGVGGYTDVVCHFRQGEKVTIHARASKMLGELLVLQGGNKVLGRIKSTKKVNYSFVVPSADSVTFHFISDRGGSNKIDYEIMTDAR